MRRPRFPIPISKLTPLSPLLLACSLHAQQPPARPSTPPIAKIDAGSAENAGRLQLTRSLNHLAARETKSRRDAMEHIVTRAQATARQKDARASILRLIGGLPERTPLQAQVLGESTVQGVRIQKILFQSQPGFYVTALLYLPPEASKPSGKLPAIVMAPGHGPAGKASDFPFAMSFAVNGFAVLSYDPIGQGERLQYLDPATGQSLATRPTGEHGEAGVQPTLVGDALSRYFIWDGMRAVDYLLSRPEIDANRIGAFGCSGGGTMTAMLSAMDDRIHATGTACYITGFDELLGSIGPQDSEQSIPNFIASGLDFPDWVELAAPRPYAIISTTSDMFPFAGAQSTEAEARRFYRLFDADAKLAFITGPGGHGNLRPILPQILGFFLRNLRPDADVEHPQSAPLIKVNPDILQVTSTGQVSSAFPNAETVHTLNLKRLAQIAPKPSASKVSVETVRRVIHATAIPGAWKPSVTSMDPIAVPDHHGLELTQLTLHMPDEVDLPAEWIAPRTGRNLSVLLLLDPAIALPAADPAHQKLTERMLQAAASGQAVLAFAPRPSPPGKEETKSPLLGPFYLTELRAELTGKTLIGLRTDDVIRAMDMLCSRKDVACNRITAESRSHLGLVLLHAAMLDARLHHVEVSGVLESYRGLVQEPIPEDAPQDILPGVLREYDIPGLLLSLGSRAHVEAKP